MGRFAKVDTRTGAVTGIREGENLPPLPDGMIYLELASNQPCDPDRHYVDDAVVLLRERLPPVSLRAAVGETVELPAPEGSWVTRDGFAIVPAAEGWREDETGTVALRLVGRYARSIELVVSLTGAAPPRPPLTPLAFQRLFSQAERIAIRTSDNVVVEDFMALSAIAQEIDLADPDVIAGVGYLEAVGMIGAGRAAIILAL